MGPRPKSGQAQKSSRVPFMVISRFPPQWQVRKNCLIVVRWWPMKYSRYRFRLTGFSSTQTVIL